LASFFVHEVPEDAMLDCLNRREFLATSAGLALTTVAPAASTAPKKVAAAVTVYTLNSHAEVVVGRLLEGYNLNGTGGRPNLQLVSLYVDQRPKGDLSRDLARKHGFTLAPSIAEALTLGGQDLAVDGVLLIGEHGQYPTNAKGETLYPRRRFFEDTIKVFRRVHRVVPVFSDKHLAATWEDAHWMYDTARELKVPLMAGSSLPGAWRKPPLDTRAGSVLTEMAAVTYHTPDAYGIHALEMVQCLAERRRGGETGVAAVRWVEGPDVWKLGAQGGYDPRLLEEALNRCEGRGRIKGRIEDAEKKPILFQVEYRDGLKANVFTQNLLGEWATAWREQGKEEPQATLFWVQDERPVGHFSFLVQGIERMIHTGKPTWPVERTLLTTGVMDALFDSKVKGARVETPHLAIRYQPTFTWKEPPPPPAGRPYTVP
jgi:hypothetical protein